MKKLFAILGTAASLVLSSRAAQAQTYQQVWADEFTNGYSADWKFDTGNNNGWGNHELEYYQQANATVANGMLQIAAKRENVGGFNYTSARMTTKGKDWGYGKVEARIKMPLGNGLWPAFWMLGANIDSQPWPACGEIDILEHVNSATTITATEHWSDASNQHAFDYTNTTISNPGDWHVYAVERTADYIKTSIDGTVYKTFTISNSPNGTDELQKNFFILLNLAVGGDLPFASYNGNVTAVDDSKLPATMYVDYVRVSQLVTAPAANSLFIEAENYSSMSGVQIETCTDTGGGQNVGYIDTKDFMVYNSINFPTSGAYTVEYRVASINGGQLSSDLNAGSIALGNLTVPATGGWQNWTTIAQTVNVNAGTYNFGVFAQAGGWNLNWLRITKQASSSARSAVGATSAVSLASAASLSSRTFTADLYPNPSSQGQRLQLTLGNYDFAAPADVTVTDLLGKVVLHKLVTAPNADLTAGSSLASGTYVVRISGGGTSLIKKVAIQ
ncbi:MAG: carbohydrate-binding protein [Janthinobacterium lividum]